jgi:lantibiotic modifying enzyme
MTNDIQSGNYDFLHSAPGVGMYFLSRFDKKEVPVYLEELLTALEKSGEPCENGAVKWISVLKAETGEKGYNICLSHGMSSISAFLIRFLKLNFETERVTGLLKRTVTYILDQMTYTEGGLSFFPSYSKESSPGNHYSRLGWCYGDLGIAHILWQASVVLKNKDWENIALKILKHTTINRRDLEVNAIRDAGICHGSAGVLHVFWSLFLKTGQQEFQEATDYWVNVTLKMQKYDDGLVGYKAWRTEEYGGPENSDLLLEGIAGIGIVLLSYLDSDQMAWDECFMLSY